MNPLIDLLVVLLVFFSGMTIGFVCWAFITDAAVLDPTHVHQWKTMTVGMRVGQKWQRCPICEAERLVKGHV